MENFSNRQITQTLIQQLIKEKKRETYQPVDNLFLFSFGNKKNILSFASIKTNFDINKSRGKEDLQLRRSV